MPWSHGGRSDLANPIPGREDAPSLRLPADSALSFSPASGVAHPVTGNSSRAGVTVVLRAAIIVVVLVGLITKGPTESFTTYIAPLSALAGTVLRFWFGSETHRG